MLVLVICCEFSLDLEEQPPCREMRLDCVMLMRRLTGGESCLRAWCEARKASLSRGPPPTPTTNLVLLLVPCHRPPAIQIRLYLASCSHSSRPPLTLPARHTTRWSLPDRALYELPPRTNNGGDALWKETWCSQHPGRNVARRIHYKQLYADG